MRWSLNGEQGWHASVRRISIHAAVLAVHLGIVLVLLGDVAPAWREWHREKTAPKQILRLRFVAAPMHQTRTAARTHSAPSRKKATVNARIRVAAHPAPTIRTAPAKPVQPTRPAHAPDTARMSAPGYVPGGNLVRGGMQLHPSGPRLPGSSMVIVPGLQLADPRTQGIGGAVRKLQALFGVADPHCIDVDAWRTLSTQELLDRHLSPQQVASTAEHYGCGAGKSP